jgi:hypothetical protein
MLNKILFIAAVLVALVSGVWAGIYQGDSNNVEVANVPSGNPKSKSTKSLLVSGSFIR